MELSSSSHFVVLYRKFSKKLTVLKCVYTLFVCICVCVMCIVLMKRMSYRRRPLGFCPPSVSGNWKEIKLKITKQIVLRYYFPVNESLYKVSVSVLYVFLYLSRVFLHEVTTHPKENWYVSLHEQRSENISEFMPWTS